MSKRVTKKSWVSRKHGYRSGLEEEVSKQIASKGIPVDYEGSTIQYIIPATEHTYHPDFRLPNEIIVETKGRFVLADRKKHLLIKAQHPTLDIRFVFSNSKNKITKRSKTTYAMWCDKHGFKYADKTIPSDWFKE